MSEQKCLNLLLAYERNILKQSQWIVCAISFVLAVDASTSQRMHHTRAGVFYTFIDVVAAQDANICLFLLISFCILFLRRAHSPAIDLQRFM